MANHVAYVKVCNIKAVVFGQGRARYGFAGRVGGFRRGAAGRYFASSSVAVGIGCSRPRTVGG